MTDNQLDLWESPRSFDLAKIAEVARDRLAPADAPVLASSRSDVLTVQVAEGWLTESADFLVYVGGRGAFEVLRREVWPGERILLTLRAWPSRP